MPWNFQRQSTMYLQAEDANGPFERAGCRSEATVECVRSHN